MDFKPKKSGEDFHDNYKLHDLADAAGKNLLIQWNIKFQDFGEDRRYEQLWEKGKDKPDSIITFRDKSALIDWKGKHSKSWIVNSRAVKSYEFWQKKLNLPVIVCFFVFSQKNTLIDRRFALLNKHNYTEVIKLQWDKNKTVEFTDELPVFSKTNLLKFVFV